MVSAFYGRTHPSLPEVIFRDLVKKTLTEDLGSGGDITSERLIDKELEISAEIVAREPGMLAGDSVAALTFKTVDPNLVIDQHVSDGEVLSEGAVVAEIKGLARSILSAERTALNFIGHLSGVATATNRMVAAVANTESKICCTRKTTPGLRGLEKYAVRIGGGGNHSVRGFVCRSDYWGLNEPSSFVRASIGQRAFAICLDIFNSSSSRSYFSLSHL